MTTQELIDRLMEIKDKQKPIKVYVNQHLYDIEEISVTDDANWIVL